MAHHLLEARCVAAAAAVDGPAEAAAVAAVDRRLQRLVRVAQLEDVGAQPLQLGLRRAPGRPRPRW